MERPALPPIVVLIVEDDPVILMTAADALRQAGLSILEAETGDAAAEILASRPSDIGAVFSDIEMPGALDGLALARLIGERWPAIPVILTSGRVTPAPDALASCARFLAKPYDLTHVSSLVRELIES